MRWTDQPVRLLFTWARWLTLRHPTTKVVNLWVPAFGIPLWVGLICLLPSFNVTRDFGLIQQVNGLLEALAPFFVAALALVAGFPGEALDRPMGGVQPFLMVAGEPYYPKRREVLGYLFAYLAGLSVLMYLCGAIVLASTHPEVPRILGQLAAIWRGWLIVGIKAAYGSVLLHLISVTFLGLHFLGNFMSGSRLSRASPPSSGPPGPPLVSGPESSLGRRVQTPLANSQATNASRRSRRN